MNLTQEKPKKVLQDAAATIQRAWRRYKQMKVFSEFKEIIMCCMDQNPRTALKTVNPREVELLDEAAGIFIKFRLGGNNFPPHIYYKIFTYMPMMDVCAGFPWECIQHRHSIPAAQLESCWYQRVENNSWRLYLGRVVNRDGPEEIGLDKKMDFHYSKLQRKQDVARWKKRRKIKWWEQMWDRGCLQADPEHRHSATIVDSSGHNVMENTEEDQDDDICDEHEVDELLSWANALDFDKYMSEWKQLAHCHY